MDVGDISSGYDHDLMLNMDEDEPNTNALRSRKRGCSDTSHTMETSDGDDFAMLRPVQKSLKPTKSKVGACVDLWASAYVMLLRVFVQMRLWLRYVLAKSFFV